MPPNGMAIGLAKAGCKLPKTSDERGLFLRARPRGGKLWRLKYRMAGKEKKLSLGRWPDIMTAPTLFSLRRAPDLPPKLR